MRRMYYVSSLACVFAAAHATGQTPGLVGTWQGNLHGVKAVTITLRKISGRPAGNAVFYIVHDEGAGWHNSAPSPDIPLQNVRREGATLFFSVKGSNGQPLQMEMKLAGPNTATLTRKGNESKPELTITVRRASAR